MKFNYLDFLQDISECVAADCCSGNNLYICPSYSSLAALQKAFQHHSSFVPSIFITMDDFKLRMLPSHLPQLKEEKRTLALYATLCRLPRLKSAFHINDYFQSLPLARKFFDLFTELAEELVSFEQVKIELEKRETQNQWQVNNFLQLLELRREYKLYLNSHAFTDLIFLLDNNLPDQHWTDQFGKVIILNQFYFTRLEISLLPAAKTEVYLQLPPSMYDEDNLSCRPEFSAADLREFRTRNIVCHVFSDEFSLKYDLFSQQLSSHNTFIDTGLMKDHLETYLVNTLSGSSFTLPFCQSNIFRFLKNLHQLISQLISEKDKLLLPLNALLCVASDENFIRFFLSRANIPAHQLQYVYETLYNWLYKLIDNNYKFIDLDLEIISCHEPQVKSFLVELFNFLQRLASLNSFQEFIRFMYSDSINSLAVFDEKECRYSELPDMFQRALLDFCSLDNIGIIEDWQLLVDNTNRTGFELGSALLKLFLNYCKAKHVRWFCRNEHQISPVITSLNNTRNLRFDNICFIDAIEGNLPPARKIPFLLTENQRSALGLKTYSDIVLREKYYFLRLIAQARYVTILTRQQESDATEISSFVEELRLALPHLFSQNDIPINYDLTGHCLNWLKPASPEASPPSLPSDFFSLPFQPEFDLKQNHLYVSPSSATELINQPFNYYFNSLLHLRERPVNIDMIYSGKQLGDIVHATFARIWSRMIDRSQHETVLHDFRFNRDNYARRALENFLSDTPRLLLQVPHNHSDSYFNKIVCQHIIDSIIYFMAECDQRFSNLPLKIFPEDELFDPQSLKSVKLWDFDKFSVSLKGRADLRIEVIPSNESHIFDYKTSSFHKSDKSEYYDQLCLYQILYYPRADKVTKWIYFAFQPYLQSFDSKTELCQNLLEKLKNIIADLYYSGYNLGEKKGKYEDIFLTRRNLKRLQGEL